MYSSKTKPKNTIIIMLITHQGENPTKLRMTITNCSAEHCGPKFRFRGLTHAPSGLFMEGAGLSFFLLLFFFF